MPSGTWRATITRTGPAGTFVRIPRLNRTHIYGPCARLEVPGDHLNATDVTSIAGGAAAHAHTTTTTPPTPLTVGDRVLVSFIEDRDSDPVILGRLAL